MEQSFNLMFELHPMGKESIRVKGHAFLAEKTRDYMDTIRTLAMMQWDGEPWKGPIALNVDFFFATPHSERWGMYHFYKPDKDNLEKALYDSLRGICFKDDCQIAWGDERKFWAEKNMIAVVIIQLDACRRMHRRKDNAVP